MTKAEFLLRLDGLRATADKLPEDAGIKYACIEETFGMTSTKLRLDSGLRELAVVCGVERVQVRPAMKTTASFETEGVEVYQFE